MKEIRDSLESEADDGQDSLESEAGDSLDSCTHSTDSLEMLHDSLGEHNDTFDALKIFILCRWSS